MPLKSTHRTGLWTAGICLMLVIMALAVTKARALTTENMLMYKYEVTILGQVTLLPEEGVDVYHIVNTRGKSYRVGSAEELDPAFVAFLHDAAAGGYDVFIKGTVHEWEDGTVKFNPEKEFTYERK